MINLSQLDVRSQINLDISTCVWLQLRFLLGDQVEASMGGVVAQLWRGLRIGRVVILQSVEQ